MVKCLSHQQANFGVAAHMLQQFIARPDYGTAPEDLLIPSYWMHVARQMQPGAMIRVMPEGLQWTAEYVVIDCDQFTATVKQVSFVNLADVVTKKDKAEDFKIERVARWVRVIRKSDMKVVRGNFTSEADAQKWLAETTEV
jgi:hypothetical protein